MMNLDDMYEAAAATPPSKPAPVAVTIPSQAEIDKLLESMEDTLKPAPTGADEEFEDDDATEDNGPSYQELMLDLEHALKVLGDTRDLLGFITMDTEVLRKMDLATAVQVHKVLRDVETFMEPWEQL